MLSEKDSQFLDYLLAATNNGRIRWQPTAAEDQFTTSLKGKYSVLVGRGRSGYWLRMSNDQEEEMLSIGNDEDQRERVQDIFHAARRVALDVDSAIDEIIGGE